jgi:hypothetical protein
MLAIMSSILKKKLLQSDGIAASSTNGGIRE